MILEFTIKMESLYVNMLVTYPYGLHRGGHHIIKSEGVHVSRWGRLARKVMKLQAQNCWLCRESFQLAMLCLEWSIVFRAPLTCFFNKHIRIQGLGSDMLKTRQNIGWKYAYDMLILCVINFNSTFHNIGLSWSNHPELFLQIGC